MHLQVMTHTTPIPTCYGFYLTSMKLFQLSWSDFTVRKIINILILVRSNSWAPSRPYSKKEKLAQTCCTLRPKYDHLFSRTWSMAIRTLNLDDYRRIVVCSMVRENRRDYRRLHCDNLGMRLRQLLSIGAHKDKRFVSRFSHRWYCALDHAFIGRQRIREVPVHDWSFTNVCDSWYEACEHRRWSWESSVHGHCGRACRCRTYKRNILCFKSMNF